jgi:hypothetical protein
MVLYPGDAGSDEAGENKQPPAHPRKATGQKGIYDILMK